MKFKNLILFLIIYIVGCSQNATQDETLKSKGPVVHIVAAMKEAVWKGELFSKIDLDTISNKKGLYALGPVTYMRGEIMINDGEVWVSRVNADESISVKIEDSVSAPFLVYSNVTDWDTVDLPSYLSSITELEKYINKQTKTRQRPFAFKLAGSIDSATIHIQNLPLGATVSNPKEAHAGQKKYSIGNYESEIIGFFSTEHQGIFTHHDSYLHMHLITKDRIHMGHLDELEIEKMKLLLPEKIE